MENLTRSVCECPLAVAMAASLRASSTVRESNADRNGRSEQQRYFRYGVLERVD